MCMQACTLWHVHAHCIGMRLRTQPPAKAAGTCLEVQLALDLEHGGSDFGVDRHRLDARARIEQLDLGLNGGAGGAGGWVRQRTMQRAPPAAAGTPRCHSQPTALQHTVMRLWCMRSHYTLSRPRCGPT